jgi:hypothetical protein
MDHYTVFHIVFADLEELQGTFAFTKNSAQNGEEASSGQEASSSQYVTADSAAELDLSHADGVTHLVFDAGKEVVLHAYQVCG